MLKLQRKHMKGDFHARFCENLRVKLTWVTRLPAGIENANDIWNSERGVDIYLTGATLADQELIAHARQDIQRLISVVRRLNELLKQRRSKELCFKN